jgi:hypothetical protein
MTEKVIIYKAGLEMMLRQKLLEALFQLFRKQMTYVYGEAQMAPNRLRDVAEKLAPYRIHKFFRAIPLCPRLSLSIVRAEAQISRNSLPDKVTA